MCSSAPATVKPHAPVRWFHVWCLPIMWLAPVAFLITTISARRLNGESAWFAVTIVSTPGLWLSNQLGSHMGTLAACIGNVVLLALIGLFQDILHVPKRILIVYLVVPMISFICVHILGGAFLLTPAPLAYLQLMLLHFCGGLYVFSLASCFIYLLVLVKNLFNRRSERQVGQSKVSDNRS